MAITRAILKTGLIKVDMHERLIVILNLSFMKFGLGVF